MPAVHSTEDVVPGPELLVLLRTPETPAHWARIGAISLGIHVLLAISGIFLAGLPSAPPRVLNAEVEKPRSVTKLIAPQIGNLTQRAPSRHEVSKEFDLASLPPRPESRSLPTPGASAAPPRPVQKFKAPSSRGASMPAAALPDTPAPDPNILRAQGPLPAIGVPAPISPPPQIVPEEKPKLAFERPGATTGTQQGFGRIPVAKSSVEDAMRQAARSAGSRGMSVGDEDEGGPPVTPGLRPSPSTGKVGSSVELLSDPQGADFIPYLRIVLAAVRRNWYAIIPESARMGRTGRVLVQFSIEKNGGLSKIVIATPSGARELDLAAVAGVTASNPFPPLPANFRGNQIRLQFSFKYNGALR